ncbi:MAG: hypothetical protein EOO08_13220 [Chitinophagaceae bacterium]|nr:MAG: hypothetical protein EOO08_13220 [Chitinophagaceae bacterium]
MQKIIYLSLAALVLASCGSSDQESVTTTDTTTTAPAVTTTTPVSTADTAAAPASVTIAPGTTTTTTTPPPPPPAIKAKTSGSSAPNPAHGQPNHRCDIAVGAPLNSPAGTGLAQPGAQPQVQQAQPAAQPANGTVRLNPAHGEPGHDCAIPVGQPLKG